MIPALILIVAATVYRIITGIPGSFFISHLPNFSPLAAIALCGAVYLPKKYAVIVPLAALFISDMVLNVLNGVSLVYPSMLASYASLAVVCGIGFALRSRPAIGRLASGSIAGSLLFFVSTNTASWFTSGSYALTLSGWVQALTVGVPGFPPTWTFFRNTLVSDLLFTLLFVACMAVTRKKAAFTAPLDAQRDSVALAGSR